VLSSPFRRCTDTAREIVASLKAEARLESLLHEYFERSLFPKPSDPGVRPLDEIARDNPWLSGNYGSGEWLPDKNEDESALSMRVAMIANLLLAAPALRERPKIICVTHMFVIAALVRRLCPGVEPEFAPNASVSKISVSGSETRIEYLNETSFL